MLLLIAIDYWFGYYQESLSPVIWSAVLELVEFLIFPPVLLITWIISMILRKHRLWTTAMLIGLLALIGFQFTILPPSHHLIVYSMRDRVMRDYSLDDLRHFAREVDQLPRLPGNEAGPTKSFRGRELDKSGLKEKYPFLYWGGESAILAKGMVWLMRGGVALFQATGVSAWRSMEEELIHHHRTLKFFA
jgi:hypothetical protein